MNLTIQKGKLVRDPELKTVKEMSLCEFSLAVPDRLDPKNKEKVYFANCIAWKKLADIIAQYCVKGQEIIITGRNTSTKYQKDGATHYSHKIVCDSMEFCGSKPKEPEPEFEVPF